MIAWLVSKLTDAERALKCREQEAVTWREGTDAQWDAAASMHPSTKGKSLKRAARLVEADRNAKIAIKMRRDVEMYQAVLSFLGMERLNGKSLPKAGHYPKDEAGFYLPKP